MCYDEGAWMEQGLMQGRDEDKERSSRQRGNKQRGRARGCGGILEYVTLVHAPFPTIGLASLGACPQRKVRRSRYIHESTFIQFIPRSLLFKETIFYQFFISPLRLRQVRRQL